jgi:hypothetical protein
MSISLVAATASLSGAGSAFASGEVSDSGTRIPNIFADQTVYPNLGPLAMEAQLVVDPVNHYLFEMNVTAPDAACGTDNLTTPIYRLDYDRFTPLAKGCADQVTSFGGSQVPIYAIDSTDGLFFFDDPEASSTGSDVLVAVSEQTLGILGSWPLPGPASGSAPGTTADGTGIDQAVYGLSWNAAGDQLLVLTSLDHRITNGTGALPPSGVTLLSYDLGGVDFATGGTPVAAWSSSLPSQCSQPLGVYSHFGTANPYESPANPFLFVPCAQTVAAGGQSGGAVIVRLDLTSVGGSPTGSYLLTEVPGQSTDFYSDPGSDRGFMPTDNNAGTAMMVYDGDLGSFVGQVAVASAPAGGINPNFGCDTFTVDPTTGRIYALGPSGLVDAVGRSTPVQPGTTYIDDGADVYEYAQSAAVLPPDAAHPETRVALARLYSGGHPADEPGCGESNPTLPFFSAFNDSSQLPPPPLPPESVDRNTLQGPVPPGSAVSSISSGTAEAVGFRDVWTGSYGGAADTSDNNGFSTLGVDGTTFPLGGGTRDLLAGWVQQAKLLNAATLGTATAFGDGNGASASGTYQCSDPAALNACGGQSGNPFLGALTPGLQSFGAVAPNLGQQWPSPTASCSQPGPQDQKDVTSNGLYVTTGYQQTAGGTQAQTAQVPGSIRAANSEADCAAGSSGNGVDVTGVLNGADLRQGSGSPSVSVAYASGAAEVVPPTGSHGTVSTATAITKGIEISLPTPGLTLDIGEVVQSASATAGGVARSASATDTVQVADVSVTTPDGQTHVLCQQTTACTQGAIDQINTIDPSYLQVQLADPDHPFGSSGSRPGTEKVNGSPGGYLGVVESTQPHQAYDATFNDIPASDGETAMIPGLRVTLYYDSAPNGSAYQRDRQVLDLAPVEVDAEEGLSAVPEGVVVPGTNPGSCDTTCVSQYAADTGRYVPGGLGSYGPASAGPGAPWPLGLIKRLFKRVLEGIGLALRDPADALKFFGLLLLLGLPVVVMVRRDRWLRRFFRHSP